ncbi:MAG: sulfotransferase family 2 domain-containing protein [Verrucomicrobiota bacterium]
MPVFRSSSGDGTLAFVSYKATYSQFNQSDEWKELNINLTPRIFLRALTKASNPRRAYFVVREPYARIESCFKDKYRKQPQRIAVDGFYWQACHRLIYPYIGITESDSDQKIAEAFLNFSFEDFVKLLPKLHSFDGHFQPQHWSNRLTLGNKRLLALPGCEIIRIEDRERFAEIPGIRVDSYANSTKHLNAKTVWTPEMNEIVRKIYRHDFTLGQYPNEPKS